MAQLSLNSGKTRAGKWVKQFAGPEDFSCFVPANLPPDPPIQYDLELHDLQDRANRALGRVGRLLITFILCAEGVLTQPLLYLSLYFKQNREAYYKALQRIRTDGDWEGWLKFYFSGVEQVSIQASETAKSLLQMFDQDRSKIEKIGQAASSALRVYEVLKKRVLLSLPNACEELKMSFPAVSKAISNLEKLGLVREFTGKQRNRIFAYDAYLKVLAEGTETRS